MTMDETKDLKGPEEPNLFSHESEWDFSSYERYLLFLHERNFSDIVKLTNEDNIHLNIIPLFNSLYLLWKQLKSLFVFRKGPAQVAERQERVRAEGLSTKAYIEYIKTTRQKFMEADLDHKKEMIKDIRGVDLSTELYDELISILFRNVRKVVLQMYRSNALTKQQVIQAFWDLLEIYGYIREYKAMKGLGIRTRKILKKKDILRAVSTPSV